MVEGDRPRSSSSVSATVSPIEREVSPSVALALSNTLPCRYEWRPPEEGVA